MTSFALMMAFLSLQIVLYDLMLLRLCSPLTNGLQSC